MNSKESILALEIYRLINENTVNYGEEFHVISFLIVFHIKSLIEEDDDDLEESIKKIPDGFKEVAEKVIKVYKK